MITTHKHWDHAGHNYRYAESQIPIVGGADENVAHATTALSDLQTISFFDDQV